MAYGIDQVAKLLREILAQLKVGGSGGGGGGDASAANQVLGNTSLTSIDGKTPALGQALAAASTPVVLTAAQLTTLTPSATSTAAKQDTGNTSLGSIDTKTPSLGQALAASSVPVVLTAIQVAALTPSKGAGLVDSGTTRVSVANNLPFGADYMIQSNADSNGNYQTIVYKSGGSGGSPVRTITLTFDSSSNVLTYTES